MQEIDVIYNLTIDTGFYGLVNIGHIGNHRADSSYFHALISAPAHTPAQQNLTI